MLSQLEGASHKDSLLFRVGTVLKDDEEDIFRDCGSVGIGGNGLSGLVRGGIARMKDLNDRTGRSIPCRCEDFSIVCVSGDGVFGELIPRFSRTVLQKSK